MDTNGKEPKVGDRIRVVKVMDQEHEWSLKPGMEGVVSEIHHHAFGYQIFVRFDDKKFLAILDGEDEYEII